MIIRSQPRSLKLHPIGARHSTQRANETPHLTPLLKPTLTSSNYVQSSRISTTRAATKKKSHCRQRHGKRMEHTRLSLSDGSALVCRADATVTGCGKSCSPVRVSIRLSISDMPYRIHTWRVSLTPKLSLWGNLMYSVCANTSILDI
jgi:hypothetical protein